VKWSYPRHTLIKIALSFLMAIGITIKEYFVMMERYNSPFDEWSMMSVEFFLSLHQIIVWLSYGLLLGFDMKRALYNDWKLLKPFHLMIILSFVFALMTFYEHETWLFLGIEVSEFILNLIMTYMVFKYPRDFPKKKNLYTSLLPKKTKN
jgi:hypothetical protein